MSAVHVAYAGSQAAQDISGLVRGGGEIALNALLLLVGAFFFAADPPVYERGVLLLVPPRHRPAFEDALFDVASTLRLWLRAQDRKSTRLNSSHLVISYAVFCL